MQPNTLRENQHLELGVINTLLVDRDTPHGLFLVSQDEKDVLLPKSYVTEDMEIGTLVDVFLYTDSEDRLVATTLTPKAKLDEYGFFEVVDVAKFGAFVDWGLPKDLLVPNKLQKSSFKMGEKRFLKVVYDERTHRLVGSEKTQDFFTAKPKGLKTNQEVKITIIAKTPLGYKCIVNGKYEGLIYQNEVFEKIGVGDEKKAYVKNIRKDKNLDISLQPSGNKKKSSDTQRVLELLKQNSGIMPYNYKSDAELITDVFSMSKKSFKKSLTKLQDDGVIEIKDTGIYLKAD